MRVGPAVLLAAACGPHAAAPTAAPPAIPIVVSEVGPLGARLVVVDAHGDRQAELLRPVDVQRGTVDKNPAISPDGRSIVFESNRGGRTQLWLAPLAFEAVPTQLTSGELDEYPAWTRDGSAIVFARQTAAQLDLYRIRLADRHVDRLTSTPASEVTPSVASDGTIYFGVVSDQGAHLEARAPDGTIRQISHGPLDTAPAVSPDDNWIAYSRTVEHNGTPDADLWLMRVDGSQNASLVDLPIADESGPVWSPDGHYVLATSAVRSVDGGRVLTSSVIVIDLETRHARILADRAGYLARLTPAIAPRPLDGGVLAGDPEYLPALARIISNAVAAQSKEPGP